METKEEKLLKLRAEAVLNDLTQEAIENNQKVGEEFYITIDQLQVRLEAMPKSFE